MTKLAPPGRVHALAKELARPVARGWLTLTVADIALLNATVRTDLGRYQFTDLARGAQHSLRLWLDREQLRRDLASHRIRRTLAPLIAQRARSRTLLAEAHGVNGKASFPLTEGEVKGIVEQEVYWAIRRMRRG